MYIVILTMRRSRDVNPGTIFLGAISATQIAELVMSQAIQHARSSRPRNRVVLVFGAVGLFIPIVLYSLVSFADRDLRTHSRLSHFLWSIAIPYLWPSAAALLPATANNLGDSIVFWTMSLVLNVVIYAVMGFALSRLSRFASGSGTKSK